MSELTKQLRIKAGMINLGERIEWGSETALMETAANRIDHLEAELAKLRAGQEPVEWRCRVAGSDHYAHFPTKRCRFCEPLYTTPQPRAVPDGFLIVPIQPTEEMRKRAQDYLAAEGMIVSDWLVHTVYTEMLAAAPAQGQQVECQECERLRMQLAACGVVALANTPESAAQARQMHPDYMSASCSDVADAVDREIALRQQLAERDARMTEAPVVQGLSIGQKAS